MSAGATIKLRRDTTANWAAANPVLAEGEPGLNTDNDGIKYGDGVTAWNSLPYATIVPTAAGNIIPALGNTFTLGNVTNPWAELYLSGNTIYLGNVVLGTSDGALLIDGSVVTPDGGNVIYDNISVVGNIVAAYFSGNGAGLTGITASNIGTLVNLSVTGNVVAGNVLTDNLKYANGTPWDLQQPAGANNQVQYNNNGSFGASANFSFNPGANTLTVTGTSSTTGNIIGGNVTTAGTVSAAGNVVANYFVGDGSALANTMTDRGAAPTNWNTMTQMGVYTVNRVSWSGTTGTPLDSQVYVGLVEVKNSTETALAQVFYPGTVESGNVKIQWNRTYWAGSWSSWLKIVNDDQVVVGGTY